MFDNNRCLRYTTITPTSGINTLTTLSNIIPEGEDHTSLGISPSDKDLILASDVICIQWTYYGPYTADYSFCIFLTALSPPVNEAAPTTIFGITYFNSTIVKCAIAVGTINTIGLTKVLEA